MDSFLFAAKTKSGFCACATTFQKQSNELAALPHVYDQKFLQISSFVRERSGGFRDHAKAFMLSNISFFVLFFFCVVLCIVCLFCRSVYCLCVNVYCTVLYCTVLYCTVLYCTVLHCTILYCTVLYCTVLLPPGVNPIAVNKYMKYINIKFLSHYRIAPYTVP
jgi:hypothetical protein